ncbi:MFS family permease [Ancylobacter sp. 3268]|uniref:MFS transporter n=1 Tax=Ancylobacter sp. 3268 TaxID=2817752 RepID=UPI00286220DA|nr:MFS transporter [Ancylobacter sp. 3268]MDR6951275.1 MFS family permease [Ancylobacter sp. 3268]
MSRLAIVSALGITQIMAWGSSYYLSAVLAGPVAAETGWALAWVVGGLSIGLLTAGLVSPWVGRAIGRHGGRGVLALSTVLIAAGQVTLGLSQALPVYVGGWLVLGLGMGAGLYDAAFATLGRLFGSSARPAITVLTLWGGFASTVCWPLSASLVGSVGWRNTCFIYAAIQIGFSLPLLLRAIPRVAPPPARSSEGVAGTGPLFGAERRAFVLLAAVMILAGAITATLSVHLLTLLQAQGLSLADAVLFGALVGPAQVGGRLVEMAGRGRHHPLWSLGAACGLIALGLLLLWSGVAIAAIGLLLYGAGNGVFSIARGTLPLALFGPERYAALMGRLARPSLVAQAAAPFVSAFLIEHGGSSEALGAVAILALGNALLVGLLWQHRRPAQVPAG